MTYAQYALSRMTFAPIQGNALWVSAIDELTRYEPMEAGSLNQVRGDVRVCCVRLHVE
jgi:hypothetical protein